MLSNYQPIIQLIEQAGTYVHHTPLTYTAKNDFDYVSSIDLAIEHFLIKGLTAINPTWSYLSEESRQDTPLSDGWIIDPIDGTTNLLHSYPHFAISIAHVVAGEVVFGAIYNPMSKEMYTAQRHQGAFLNGKPIYVAQHTSLQATLIGIGLPYNRDHAVFMFEKMAQLYPTCQDIKRKGSAALDLAYVACGRLDAYFEVDLKPWDIAAGKLLIEEAGGCVHMLTSSNGLPITLATNNTLSTLLTEILCDTVNE